MANLTLYTNPWSRGRTVRWMLEETGLPYEVVKLDYGTTMKAPDYLALNRMGKVPALVHGDTVVTEVAAICMHLADLVPERKLAPAVGSPQRGSYYRWISFMGPVEAMATAKMRGGPRLDPQMAGYGDEQAILATLDEALRGREHLAGHHFTAADLMVAAYVGWFIDFKMLPPLPALAHFARLHRGRPAAVRAGQLDDAMVKG